MADQVITKQELIDAQKDAQALEEVINGEPGKLIKTRLGRLVYTLASVPQINTMTREEVTSALAPKADKTETAAALDTKANQADTFLKSEVTGLVAPKADKTYVDSAIGAISTDASKQYATLALANADIANIALNKNIFVSEAANGGYWYKATAGATSLTKSAYDPVELGKKSFLNTFDTFAQLEASSLDRYAFAAVVNDPDHSKNGYYQKIVDYSWSRVRLNSEIEIRNFLSKKGFAILVPLQPTNINYSSTDKTLTFTGTVYALTERGTYTINAPVTLNLPENQAYRVEFNETSKDIRCVVGGSNREDGWLIVATIHKTSSGIYTSDFSGFNVDGAQQPTVVDVLALDTMKADLQTTSLTINLTDLTATIPEGAFAYTAKGRVAVPTQTVTGLATIGRRNFMLSKADQTVTAVTDSVANPLIVAKTHYLLFTYDAAKQVAIGYTGVLNIVGAPNLIAKPNYSLIFTRPSSLNFDFNNNKIVISENLWLPYDGTRLLITPTAIPLDPARNKGFRTLLLVDPSTSQIVLRSSAAGYSAPKDHVLIGAYHEADMLFFGLEHFSVNGVVFNSNVKTIKPVFGWSVNNQVSVDVADTFLPLDATNLSNLTSSTVYGWFDALVAAHPDYITKTLLGNDASGALPIYQYRFNPKRVGTDGRLDTKIPKIMLMTQHNEGINFAYIYLLMREICNNWKNNEALESMRFGMEFVVIPVGNPWGLDNGNRKNSNLVDLNRNFPIGWMKLGTPSDTSYSGESALSEAEVQHIYNVMTTEKPDMFFDCHSYGAWNNNGQSVWQPVLSNKSRVAAMSTAQKVYAQYKKKYDWLVDLDALVYISDSTVTGGGLASKSAESVGAVGGTIEIAWNLKDEPSGLTGHSSVINFATDYLGTSILQALSVIISSK